MYEEVGEQEVAVAGRSFRKRNVFRGIIAAVVVTGFVLLILSSAGLHQAHNALEKAKEGANPPNGVRSYSIRLLPGQDLIVGVMNLVNEKKLKAAWIMSAVGSLDQFAIRYANMPNIDIGRGHFEIVSLVGTMTIIDATPNPKHPVEGAWHLHISIGDGTGKTISGHLGLNSTVYTTAEIQIGYSCDVEYSRAVDGSTPWDELQIAHKTWC